MYSTMCFTSAGTSCPLTVCARVTSSSGTPKTRVVLAEPPPSLPGNGDTPLLMASSSPQSRQDLTSAKRDTAKQGLAKWKVYTLLHVSEPSDIKLREKRGRSREEEGKRAAKTVTPAPLTELSHRSDCWPINNYLWIIKYILWSQSLCRLMAIKLSPALFKGVFVPSWRQIKHALYYRNYLCLAHCVVQWQNHCQQPMGELFANTTTWSCKLIITTIRERAGGGLNNGGQH